MSVSGLKKTTFGRKFVRQYTKKVSKPLRNGVMFTVTCPKDGLLIRYRFTRGLSRYVGE